MSSWPRCSPECSTTRSRGGSRNRRNPVGGWCDRARLSMSRRRLRRFQTWRSSSRGIPGVADLVDDAGVEEHREEDERLLLLGVLDDAADQPAPGRERAIEERLRGGRPVRVGGEATHRQLVHHTPGRALPCTPPARDPRPRHPRPERSRHRTTARPHACRGCRAPAKPAGSAARRARRPSARSPADEGIGDHRDHGCDLGRRHLGVVKGDHRRAQAGGGAAHWSRSLAASIARRNENGVLISATSRSLSLNTPRTSPWGQTTGTW